MMKLFFVSSPESLKNETQHNVNVQQEQKKSATFSVNLGRKQGQEKGEENTEGEGAKRKRVAA